MNSPADVGTLDLRVTLDDIFQTVCDLPPDKRSAYLNEACAGDEAMRREVEELIQYYETNKTFLEKPAIQDVAQQMVESGAMATPTPEPLIGKVIGNYRILSTIFAGGMGEVYLARDLSLDVDVAVKFLRREFNDDPEWQARLEREARLQAGLNHPNIVGIHYKGEFDGRPFLVFEFVPGETLKDKLDKGPLSIKEALPLFSQLAEALAHAHQNGIIHRDLKPSNLMVTPTGQLKVLDFGIAKKITTDLTTVDLGVEAGELTRDYGKTRKGEVMGTVAYMSPEQTRGEPLDVHTDVWAFGCVLYESLAGKRPFGGINTYDILNSIRTDEPDWKKLPPDTPPRIRSLISQCLQKTDSVRPGQIKDLKKVIDEVHHNVIFTGRLKRAVAIAATVLVLGLSVFLTSKYRKPSLPSLALTKLQVSSSCQAPGIDPATLLSQKLLGVPGINIQSPIEIPAKLSGAKPGEIANSLDAEMVLIGTLQCSGNRRYSLSYEVVDKNNVQIASKSFDESSTNASIAQEQLVYAVASDLKIKLDKYVSQSRGQKLDRSKQLEQAQTYLRGYAAKFNDPKSESQQFVYLDRYDQEPAVDAAILLLEELASSPGSDAAQVQAQLSQAYFYKYNLTFDRSYRDKSQKMYESAASLNSNLPEVGIALGQVLIELSNYKSAIVTFQRVLDQSQNNREAMMGLARAYEGSGDYAAAEQAYLNLVRVYPQYWDAHNQLGGFYCDQEKYDLAIKSWTEVTNLLPLSWVGYDNLGTAYYYKENISEAAKMYQRALELEENAQTHLNYGTLLFFQRDFAGAVAHFDRARLLAPRLPKVWGFLADGCSKTLNCQIPPKAAYEEAILLANKILEAKSSFTYLRSLTAEWQAKIGQTDDALKNIAQAVSEKDCDPSCFVRGVITYYLVSERAKQQGNSDSYLIARGKTFEMLRKAIDDGYPATELAQSPELGELIFDPLFKKIVGASRGKG